MSPSTPDSEKLVLCPYCGHAQQGGDRCQDCGGLFEPLSRRATQIAMGPWYIRDKQRPFKPGCCYDILKRLAETGKIKPTTVMRGPTTKQFWSIARNVPGIAHLVGYCHACNAHVSPNEPKCPDCGAMFGEPRNRNELGISYKTEHDAQRAQRELDAELRGEPAPGGSSVMAAIVADSDMPTAPSSDLLAEVMSLSADKTPPPPTPVPGLAPRPKPETLGAKPATPPTSVDGVPLGTSAFDDIAPTGPLPEGRGISPIVWVLVALNLILISAVVVVVLLSK